MFKPIKEIPTGKTTIPAKGTLWQLVLDPKNGQMVDKICLLDRCCEFPHTNPQNVSRQHQSLYVCLHQPETDPVQERYNGLACYHYPTQQVHETHFDPQWYSSEPLIIPKKEAVGTWVILVVYNGNTQQSQVFILEGDCLEADPIAIVNLPSFMPLAFHGTWYSH